MRQPSLFSHRAAIHFRPARIVVALLSIIGLGVAAVPLSASQLVYHLHGGFGASTVDPWGLVGGQFDLYQFFDPIASPIEGTAEVALYRSQAGYVHLAQTQSDGVYASSSLAAVFEFPADLLQLQVTSMLGAVPWVSQLGIAFLDEASIQGNPPRLPEQFTALQVDVSPSFFLGPPVIGAQFEVLILADRVSGDADGDAAVGLGDYALWAAQFGTSGYGLSADFNYDGTVGAADYSLWAANFHGGSGDSSVPEPGAIALAALGATLLAASFARRPGVRFVRLRENASRRKV